MFQSTHPHGVRLNSQILSTSLLVFQSTHPHGVRPSIHANRPAAHSFNPRTHTVCDGSVSGLKGAILSFNPRTHTGCDLSVPRLGSVQKRFNPRTHTGCDSSRWVYYVGSQSFNPRTHTGCDASRSRAGRRLPVSIHAPTRGATWRSEISIKADGFQSTHPHGVRHYAKYTKRHNLSFNPRTHTGCDTGDFREPKRMYWFQSTHPHGVRLSRQSKAVFRSRVSIHAPTRGATFKPSGANAGRLRFNPRTHTGCDLPNGLLY